MTRFRIVHLSLVVPLLTAAVLAAGCVSTTLELATNHPARPEAAVGAGSDPAAILRPEAALGPSAPAPVEQDARAEEPDGSRENPYVGRGVVRDVGDGALTVEHEDIPGFMGAMTMPYPVAEEVNVGNLEAGDAVMFRIELPESGGYRIFQVEAIRDAEPEQEGTPGHAGPDSEQSPAGPEPRR